MSTTPLWIAGLTLLGGALMVCAGMAWPDLADALARRDRPGDVLTSTLADHNDHAVQAGLVGELPTVPRRPQPDRQQKSWDRIVAGYKRTAAEVTYQRTEQQP